MLAAVFGFNEGYALNALMHDGVWMQSSFVEGTQ